MRRLTAAGDTIVEVLIAMAVVSLILGGAFVTTHNSQIGVRNSQEHVEALKLVESQLEQLRDAASPASQIFVLGTSFCMVNDAPTVAGCKQNSASQPGQPDSRYTLKISRACTTGCSTGSAGYLFTITATWPQVTGSGNAQEQMVYRLYK